MAGHGMMGLPANATPSSVVAPHALACNHVRGRSICHNTHVCAPHTLRAMTTSEASAIAKATPLRTPVLFGSINSDHVCETIRSLPRLSLWKQHTERCMIFSLLLLDDAARIGARGCRESFE